MVPAWLTSTTPTRLGGGRMKSGMRATRHSSSQATRLAKPASQGVNRRLNRVVAMPSDSPSAPSQIFGFAWDYSKTIPLPRGYHEGLLAKPRICRGSMQRSWLCRVFYARLSTDREECDGRRHAIFRPAWAGLLG